MLLFLTPCKRLTIQTYVRLPNRFTGKRGRFLQQCINSYSQVIHRRWPFARLTLCVFNNDGCAGNVKTFKSKWCLRIIARGPVPAEGKP
jgi:hypothetical protein